MIAEETDKIFQKMADCIREHNMLTEGECVIACVSGGCDSVALLLLLRRYVEEHGNRILCAHFDHMLRGAESDGDREFVQTLCGALNIPFYFECQDAAAYARERGLSLEAGAREIRYAYFTRLAQEKHARIAVAHNKNDRIETVLLNLSRGTGIHGLKGISYTRDLIIRPLLDISRRELETVCREAGVPYRTDSTNLEAFCGRNQIRLNVLPYLRENLTEDIDEKLYRLSLLAARDNDFLDKLAVDAYNKLVCDKNDALWIAQPEQFARLEEALQSRVAIALLKQYFPGGKGINLKMADSLSRFIREHRVGGQMTVGGRMTVRCYHDGIQLMHICYCGGNSDIIEVAVHLEQLDCGPEEALAICQQSQGHAVAFDRDVLEALCGEERLHTEVRYRRKGDYFTPFGAPGGKSLKKFLIDRKVPAYQRDRIPLLVCENQILWVCGIMRSQIAPIEMNTKHAIVFQYNSDNERM